MPSATGPSAAGPASPAGRRPSSPETPGSGPGSGSGRRWRAAGIASLAFGLAVLGLVAFGVIERARSGSDAGRFNYRVAPEERPGLLGQSPALSVAEGAATPGPARFAGLYPGDRMNPKYWDEPMWAGPAPFGGPAVPPGFEPVSARDVALASAITGRAERIRIGAIGLDSPVAPLSIMDLGDQREYETPVNTVGFIPETALPGAPGSGWYFGHLESFVRGEGSVFRRLPEVADLVRQDPVDIVIGTAEAEYLYRVTGTQLVHQSKLTITDAPGAEITLVTCWPPRVYDQRILVQAELIAIKRL